MSMIREALKQLFHKPATVKCPYEKTPVPEGFRGRPIWDIERCIGCGLCTRICPSGAIDLEGKGKEAEIKHYVDRCMFCGECVENCPRDAVYMSEEYELAEFNRSDMICIYKKKG